MKLKYLTLPFIALALSASAFIAMPQQAKAVSAADWKAGRIIDDAVFFNKNSMSVQQIQDFLNAKVPNCDRWNPTRFSYAGKPYGPPYTCLKEYQENPTTKENNIGRFNPDGSPYNVPGGWSAAQIIKDASDSYGINPQVLLVMLQKETAIVTDTWAAGWQYDRAMGFACPDNGEGNTANCNSRFYGFYNQVGNGAWQLKNPYFNRYGVNRYIEWQVGGVCGGTNVYLENLATASLYSYTPYQPNQAALNNLYGTGDGCSAYGNRNFWRLFNDWFGSTLINKPLTNIDWRVENLDGSGLGSLNQRNDTVGIMGTSINYSGNLYVFHYNSTNKSLDASIAKSSGWVFETIDGRTSNINGSTTNDVGKSVTATIYNNQLHIFYYDTTTNSLRHAWLNDSTSKDWIFETLDGSPSSVSGYTSNLGMSTTAIESLGVLQLFYFDATTGNLRHAWFSPNTGWKFENLDGDYGSVSGYNGKVGENPTALMSNGTLQLFYYDSGGGRLRHAWADPGKSWKFENLDGDYGSVSGYNGNVGQDPTVTIHGGSLQLFYYDSGGGRLRHAWADPGKSWKFENLDGDYGSVSGYNGNVGSMGKSISLNGILYIFYRQNNSGIMKYAWADQSGWKFANIDGVPYSVTGLTGNTGFWPTVTNSGPTIQLFYFDNEQRSLRHAFGNPF
jgi:hypothetical protein